MSFQHGLFGCFDNCTVCIITYFVPCYTAGKVAESIGRNCLLHTFMFICCPCVSLFLQCYVREEIRRQKNIEGGQCGDFCAHFCCMGCALCQEAMEMDALNRSMAEFQAIERE